MAYPSRAPTHLLKVIDPPPATVWTALKVEQQEQVVRLLTRLACTFAATPASLPKEPTRANPTRHH